MIKAKKLQNLPLHVDIFARCATICKAYHISHQKIHINNRLMCALLEVIMCTPKKVILQHSLFKRGIFFCRGNKRTIDTYRWREMHSDVWCNILTHVTWCTISMLSWMLLLSMWFDMVWDLQSFCSKIEEISGDLGSRSPIYQPKLENKLSFLDCFAGATLLHRHPIVQKAESYEKNAQILFLNVLWVILPDDDAEIE